MSFHTLTTINHKRPLHERVPLLGAVRGRMREAFYRLLRKVASTDDAKAIQLSNLQDLLLRRSDMRLDEAFALTDRPYPDLGHADGTNRTCERDDVIIISARFRSGSTLLWNLFRSIEGCTAYYEPFNERRWFDAAHGNHTDPTHRGVENYSREYQGLEELGRYYNEAWISRNLLMGSDSWDPAMKRYVEVLIERAPGRPVLQFNRIDFRLPWFRHQFPRAKIVHLYRHPREQWLSSLLDAKSFPKHGTLATFAAHDHFYLRMWAKDLKYHFPFLDETSDVHPYKTFYFIWRLSHLFGSRHSDVSLAYEDLVREPTRCLDDLFRQLEMSEINLDQLTRLIEQPRSWRWREYACDDWFRQHECYCESVLADFFAV